MVLLIQEPRKRNKKEQRKKNKERVLVQQRSQGKIIWVGHVFTKGKRVDESPFQLFKIYFPPLHNLLFYIGPNNKITLYINPYLYKLLSMT